MAGCHPGSSGETGRKKERVRKRQKETETQRQRDKMRQRQRQKECIAHYGIQIKKVIILHSEIDFCKRAVIHFYLRLNLQAKSTFGVNIFYFIEKNAHSLS